MCNARHREKSRARRCIEQVSKIIKPLESFFTAVDSAMNYLPAFVGVVWGALKFVANIAQSISAYFGSIVKVLEEFARALPFYEDYAIMLYTDSERVLKALAGVYRDVLMTCTLIRRVFKTRGQIQPIVSIICHWMNPYSKGFEDVLDSLSARRAILQDEISHEELIRQHDERAKGEQERREAEAERAKAEAERVKAEEERNKAEQERVKAEEDRVKAEEERVKAEKARLKDEEDRAKAEEDSRALVIEERRHDVLNKLKPAYAECFAKHATCQKRLLKELDPGRWLLNRPEYQTWVGDESKSGMLWVRGKPGAGKTVLASIVIEAIRSSHLASNTAVAFFYCQYDDPRKSDAGNVLPSLLCNLIEQLPKPGPMLPEVASWDAQSPETLSNLMTIIAAEFQTVFLVVDALDECNPEDRRALIATLKKLSESVKILVTSRDWEEIRVSLKNTPVISAERNEVREDLMKFIDSKICVEGAEQSEAPEELYSPPLKVNSQDLRNEIVNTLVEGADGMFLWVHLQILHLGNQSTPSDIRSALKDLPKGLDDTFIRSLTKIESLPTARRDRVRRILRWLICAVVPLTLEMLAEAVAIDEMPDNAWEPERRVINPMTLVDDCANLVVSASLSGFDASEPRVQFIHASVQDFLLATPGPLQGSPLQFYRVTPVQDAHLPIVLSCLKYIRLLPESPHQYGCLTNYASKSWIEHLELSAANAAKIVPQLCELLTPSSRFMYNWIKLERDIDVNRWSRYQ
ncbi:hypothetical protein BV25DRAFT_1234802 [Artomyces pyxidatus]|uniref:Uncharacterized protein n=1 Tax=Artomyces pyxidatus TaxID=48021 RepID=A0ACB8SQQ8_9AGAM|nr:hypothetical protein BV25DRAFT_1234802 [Artomyces pyxidatus]